jgi:hypothetical protein
LGKCADCSSPSDVHIGVVSSDLGVGAALNAAVPGCSGGGDGGQFRSQPEGMCTDTTLDPGATFISDIGGGPNFSTPDDASATGLGKVFQCIAQLGDGGCGFGQPLAALERALGADGQPPPAANAGFLRPDADLGIIFISSHDDCSVPSGSALFSTDDTADGPLTHYRCSHAGHLCQDASQGTLERIAPPLAPPPDATTADSVTTLSLANCVSNETGELTPVSKIVADIKALKPDPDNQIFVSAIIGPAAPYAVEWMANAASGGAAWPRVAPSCGSEDADGNGAFGEPGVRITEFATSFADSVVGSICDTSYGRGFQAIDTTLGVGTAPPCLPEDVGSRTDSAGNTYPDCVVSEHVQSPNGVQDFVFQPCTDPAASGCWRAVEGTGFCTGQSLLVMNGVAAPDPAHYTATVKIACQRQAPADAGACSN